MGKKASTFSTEEICVKILTYVGEHEDLLKLFVYTSGIAPQQLQASLGSKETIGYLLDFLFQQEEALLNFCSTRDISAEKLWKIRNELPGAIPLVD